jgi:hypothetical protein
MCVEGESAFAFSDKPAGEGVWADYFSSSTIVGWAAGKTGNIYTKKIGKTIFVSFVITGTSDATTASFTLPYTSEATCGYGGGSLIYAVDAGAAVTTATKADLDKNTSTVNLRKDMASGGWTNSGTKTVKGIFFYESA